MHHQNDLSQSIHDGTKNDLLIQLYGAQNLEIAQARCLEVINGYTKQFGTPPQALFSAPGRTELGGNHTDHQHGRVLAAAINLDLLAAVTPNQSGMIRIQSQGYPLMVVDLALLTPQSGEKNTSMALVRGVAAKFASLGCPIQQAGLDIYMISNVPGGSGLSSSAAFEVLIGTILNNLFFDSQLSPVVIAQIGQYAENVFFGKPCGLMDQTASSVGGVITIDFKDNANPIVDQVAFDFTTSGHALCILDSGADHVDLTDEYASITNELKAVCQVFGKDYLREVDEADFIKALPRVREAAGDRGVLRAFHVYSDHNRVQQQVTALAHNNFDAFLALLTQSGNSSAQYLQNVVPTGQTTHQELMLTIALAKSILQGQGGVRVHGGGFGGTAQAFVPLTMLDDFKTQMEAVFGKGSCHVLFIRPFGGIRLL